MLEIIINGFEAEFTDLQIDFIEENPMLINDRIPQQYSLSFEIPVTPVNLKIFGWPERVTSRSVKLKLPGEIRHSGLIFSKGEFLLMEVDNLQLKLQYKGSRVPDDFLKNLNEIEIGHYSYGTFPALPEDVYYNSTQLSEYVNAMKNEAENATHYALGPVRLSNVQWEQKVQGIQNSVKMFINYFNPQLQDFTWGAKYSQVHTPVLPYPYVHQIISAAFGNMLQSNPFAEDPDLRKLILISMNHPNYVYENLVFFTTSRHRSIIPLVDNYTPQNGNIPIEWDLKSFGQEYPVIDLLKELMKIFCMSCYIIGSKMTIEFNSDIMKSSDIADWNPFLVGEPVVYFEKAKKYVFRFEGVSTSDEKPLQSYPTIANIANVAAASETEEPVLYRHESTGGVYRVSKSLHGLSSWAELQCEVVNSALAGTPEEDNSEVESWEVTPVVRPAEMNIEQYWVNDAPITFDDELRKYHYWIPSIEKKKKNEPPYLMFFGGMVRCFENISHQYPLITNHNQDAYGEYLDIGVSLLPNHPETGLLQVFHRTMKGWVERDKIRVKATFHLGISEIKKLKLSKKIYINGMVFFIEKLSYSLTSQGISLVDADLIQS